MFDFEVLKLIWWALLGVLLIGLAVMVGMDMGVGAGLRYFGRTDAERRSVINMIAPHWEKNGRFRFHRPSTSGGSPAAMATFAFQCLTLWLDL